MIKLNVHNETSELAVVVLGISNDFGGTIGSDKAIIYKEGFKNQEDVDFLIHLFREEIQYSEIAKMEGLFRCSTMPLTRK